MVKYKSKLKKVLAKRHTLSMRQRISFIVGLFILVNLLLLSLGHLQSDTMNSVRGYVRGEGLWAKAQKDAVFHLQNYVRTGEETDYVQYQNSLKVPLGDHEARVQLQSDSPNFQIVNKGFIAGQNHPEDIPGMIRFFQRFEHFPYMSDAIAIWTSADKSILKLQQIGKNIHTALQKNNHQSIEHLLEELDVLNWKLAEQEYQFSFILSEGARWVKNVLMWVSLGLFSVMLILVMIISRRITTGIDQTEKDLMISENRFKSLYRTDMLGIVDWHGDGRILDANDAFLNMLGYSKDDLNREKINWRELTPEEGHVRDNIALAEIEMKGYCNPFEKEFIHKNGSRIPIYLGAALLDGEREKGISFIVDQTAQKHAHTEMQLSATVFDASSDGIMVTDKNRKILTINKSWCQMSGYTRDEALGQPANILRSEKTPDSFYKDMWQTLATTDCWQGDIVNSKKDGRDLHIRLSINAVRDDAQQISHYVAIFTDISERVEAEEKLRTMAHYDFLTGLANRSLFTDLLKNAVKRSKRHSSMFALMFIDLDRFKPVNDLYGHEVGDKLLQQIARRLQKILRSDDIVARLGGDEFVILLEDIKKASDASLVAQNIIDEINQPICIDEIKLDVGCSIGISLFPQDGADNIALLNSADIAMYAAKAAGRNSYFYFDSKNNKDKLPA